MAPETVYNLLWLITVLLSVGAYYLGVSDGKAVRKNARENPAPQSENSHLKPESFVLSHQFPPSVPPRIPPPDRTQCGHLSTDKFGRCEECGAMLSKWRPEDLETVIKKEAVERETKKWVVQLADKPDSPKLIN
jgi:hypothetical protein